MYSKCIRRRFETARSMKMEQMIPFFFVSQSFTINIRFICIYILRANECTSLEIVLCKIYTYIYLILHFIYIYIAYSLT